jgi:tetratricopeptide (TPR) repeat protein
MNLTPFVSVASSLVLLACACYGDEGKIRKRDTEIQFDSLVEKRDATALNFVKLAEVVFDRGDVKTALQAYKKAVELDPTDLTALRGAGILSAHYRDWRGSLSFIERAVAAHKDYKDGYWERAYCLCRLEQLDKAAEALEEARKQGSQAGCTAAAAGLHAFLKNDYTKAAAEWELAQKEMRLPSARTLPLWEMGTIFQEAIVGRAYALFAQGQYEKALAQFTFLQERQKPIMGPMHLIGAYLCSLMSREDAAAKDSVKALMAGNREPSGYDVAKAFLRALLSETNTEEVLSLIRNKEKSHTVWPGDIAYLAGKWAQHNKDAKEAESLFREAAGQKIAYLLPSVLASRELSKEPPSVLEQSVKPPRRE